MGRKPSERSSSHTEPVSLNITPYLDIVTSIMLFMMVTSTGLVQIGIINVNAPRYEDPMNQGSSQQEEDKNEEKKLNLTIGITYKGLFIAGVGGVLGTVDEGAEGDQAAKQPTPASCYDYNRLTVEMIKVKNQFPKETKVIIYAQPDVPYEILVRVMDATRQDSEGRALFYDVILSPEIA